ncbi:MAG: zinc ribbon domain-containing protein [Gammaproteobacteria bacterium]|nr:zinc ribbon domain-containing protein [Gammaproteobacteria bacterium]NND59623.1 zinc ribbon domain-containing protein [Gammaproteobacteria bacterium]
MPIYEYQCESCGHQLEALQKVSDPRLTDCPQCSESALVKRVSAPSFRLKGGGWYETDFKTGNKRNLAGDDKPKPDKSKSADKGSKDTTSKAAGAGDSKPAAKNSGTSD